MRLFRFDAQTGEPVTQYNSTNAVVSRILNTTAGVSVVSIHLAQNGVLGFHQAVQNQLFLVVQGSGWVRDKTSDRVEIVAGQGAFWEAGEEHETGTETGLMAIVIEGPGLQPAAAMQEW